ncbi:type I polyketide synthase [Streptomyces sp. NRRL WC-3742]|uniref:type I polyketide synthase n=1 Tax=Streptomyces sp. NRRL WC-3742 TaxID=1463934 RepID=UPI00068A1008|nr:type I polyketide synthase [Streptomyces sp. NRRL WC-3742]
MSTTDDPTKQAVSRALSEIVRLRTALESQEKARTEPIAVVGMACRVPGADTPDAYWDLLRAGTDAVTEIPPSRWDNDAYYAADPDAKGTIRTRRAGLVEDVDRFDAAFFGISAREAAHMDPQQRMFLETGWEALESAGIAADRLAKSRTGVYVGVTGNDYWQSLMSRLPLESLDAYALTGHASTFAAGRLSYWLGLQGPSLSVDTACSSSLVSVHLACQSLRAGESDLALAGGVNALLAPEAFVVLSRANMLSPDGRCATFDASANGYVRAEGCGVLVLKRLSAAQADGDRILALIRGSAINQDGRSSGITVPNGQAQQDVVREALDRARVPHSSIGYVEAHGTGTPLGDPIEIGALAAVLGPGREAPLVVGSAKANIGHLEAAAGMAGIIKTILALRHEEIPPQPHLRNVNPAIDLATLPVEFPLAVKPWPRSEQPRLAGVSSFGASGTNAHVVLEEAPAQQPRPAAPADTEHVVTLSARTPAALRALTERWVDKLAALGDDADVAGLAAAANTGRARFGHRLAVRAGSPDALRDRLRRHLDAEEVAEVRTGEVPAGRRPKVGFLFTGQGSQYQGMAMELHRTDPGFRDDLDECAALLTDHLDHPLLSVLAGEHGTEGLIDSTRYTQPALFSVQYALARLWMRWGVRPAAMAGHSIGEYAAACVAGMFDLKSGVALAAERARLMSELPSGGAMVAVFAGQDQVAEAIRAHSDALAIAAVNGPEHTVVSGAEGPLEEVAAAFAAAGVRTRRLTVSHAFHSPLLDPVLDAFQRSAEQFSYGRARIPLVSTLTGDTVTATTFDAGYLRDHARRPVQFDRALRKLVELGCRTFVEIGPHPHLSGMARTILPSDEYRWLAGMRRKHDDRRVLLDAAAALHTTGTDIDWAAVDHGAPRSADLPTYPFERKRHWFTGGDGPADRPSSGSPAASRSLIGTRLSSPLEEVQFRAVLSPAVHPCLTECVSDGVAIVNAGFYVESLLQAFETLTGSPRATIEGLVIPRALTMPDEGSVTTQLTLSGEAFSYHSQVPGGTEWDLHARGTASAVASDGPAVPAAELAAVAERCPSKITATDFYDNLRSRGLDLGPSARWLSNISRRDGEALARMRPADEAERALGYRLHPGVVDSALQLLFACQPEADSRDGVLIMVELGRFEYFGHDGGPLWCHALVTDSPAGSSTVIADVTLVAEDGRCTARISGVHVRTISSETLTATIAAGRSAAPRAVRAAAGPSGAQAAAERERLVELLRSGGEDEARQRIRTGLRRAAAAVLGGSPEEIDADGVLSEQGMDSLLAMELKARVAKNFDVSLPSILFFDGPSLSRLETGILDALTPGAAAAPVAAHLVPSQRSGPGGMQITEYGSGVPIVFVHGGAFGALDSWQTQLSLADRWRLVLVSRLNYDGSDTSEREDYLEDARLLTDLLKEQLPGGVHLVAQSYGTLGALHAAAAVPGAVRSLTLIESAASVVARGSEAVDAYERSMRDLVADPPADPEAFFRAFFAGIEPTATFPSPLPAALADFANRVGTARVAWPWDAEIPEQQVRAAAFPTLVVTGGERPLFEEIGDALAERLAAQRSVVPGGHGTQNTGAPFNTLLTEFLHRADSRADDNAEVTS